MLDDSSPDISEDEDLAIEKEEDVVKYVLTKGSKKERRILTSAFEEALPIINTIIEGNWQKAMLDLHS